MCKFLKTISVILLIYGIVKMLSLAAASDLELVSGLEVIKQMFKCFAAFGASYVVYFLKLCIE